MKKYLEKIIAAKEERAKELRDLIKNAATADEVRALGAELDKVNDELNEAKTQFAQLGNDEENGGKEEERGANPMADFKKRGHFENGNPPAADTDPTNTVEYRTAFMNFVCRGVAIPMELRADAATATADGSAAIPTTTVNEIVKEMKAYGEIFNRVRKLNVKGGVKIPIITLKPTASWIDEETPSESKKVQANTAVIFNFYGLECKIAQTLLDNIVSLEIFNAEFVKLAAEALVQAVEVAILNGDGTGKCLGITKDTRVKHNVTLTAEEFADWGAWKQKVFAKIPKAYRNGSFIMAQGTFDGYIDGMTDKNGQPIGRVNYGIADGETYRFGGKEVLTVETDVLADYDSATSGDVVAVFVNLADYGLNSNMEMQIVKWVDHNTNKVYTKAIMVVDGKLIDANGVVLVKKG